MIPLNLKYSEEHEWVRLESSGVAVVGITDFAVGELGDVVFVELPQIGDVVSQFGQFGEIESVKAVSELFSPISGEVVECNENVLKEPELVNKDPFEGGWLLKVSLNNPSELENLMTPGQYEAHISLK